MMLVMTDDGSIRDHGMTIVDEENSNKRWGLLYIYVDIDTVIEW